MKRFAISLLISASICTNAQYSAFNTFSIADRPVLVNTMQRSDIFSENELNDLNRQIRIRKIVGFTLAGLGAVTSGLGITAIHNNRHDPEGLGQTVGMLLVGAGAVQMGASIPFFIRAKKLREEREGLQNLYQHPEK